VGTSRTGTGSGHATGHLGIFRTGVGDGIGIQPIDVVGQGIEREAGVYTLCGGGSLAAPVDEQAFYNLIPAVMVAVQDLAYLEPDPNDPDASRGEVMLIDNQQAEPGGFDNVKQTVRWDIRRRRLP
jgi:hypothetical protein